MRIAVLGVGAIGSLLSGRLALCPDIELCIIARGEQAIHLKETGLLLESPFPEECEWHVTPDSWNVYTTIDEIPLDWVRSADCVIVCGKSGATDELSVFADKILAPKGLCISVQNGIGNEELLAEILGDERVLGASITHGSTKISAGHTRWAGRGEIMIGVMPNSKISKEDERIDEILECLFEADLSPKFVENIVSELWVKLILNVAINPIAAICGITNGKIKTIPEMFHASCATMYEAATVARTNGVEIPNDEQLYTILSNLIDSTSSNECSMLQDIKSGKKTEIRSLCGEIEKHGEINGIPTPINSNLIALITGIEATMKSD